MIFTENESCTCTVLILYSHCTQTVLRLYSDCTQTVLRLCTIWFYCILNTVLKTLYSNVLESVVLCICTVSVIFLVLEQQIQDSGVLYLRSDTEGLFMKIIINFLNFRKTLKFEKNGDFVVGTSPKKWPFLASPCTTWKLIL